MATARPHHISESGRNHAAMVKNSMLDKILQTEGVSRKHSMGRERRAYLIWNIAILPSMKTATAMTKMAKTLKTSG